MTKNTMGIKLPRKLEQKMSVEAFNTKTYKYDIKNGDYIQIKNTKKKELKIKKIKLYNQEVDIKNYNWD